MKLGRPRCDRGIEDAHLASSSATSPKRPQPRRGHLDPSPGLRVFSSCTSPKRPQPRRGQQQREFRSPRSLSGVEGVFAVRLTETASTPERQQEFKIRTSAIRAATASPAACLSDRHAEAPRTRDRDGVCRLHGARAKPRRGEAGRDRRRSALLRAAPHRARGAVLRADSRRLRALGRRDQPAEVERVHVLLDADDLAVVDGEQEVVTIFIAPAGEVQTV